jgi:hypothetical protein
MNAKWGSCALLAICLVILAGCRSTQPDLKPDTSKEIFNAPPMEGRYQSSVYPKQAFDAPADPGKRMFDNQNPGAMAGRGGMGGPNGMGGSPGMR